MAKITFIGGGNMSYCICDAIAKSHNDQNEITVSGPHLENLAKFEPMGVKVTTDNVAAFNEAEIVFFGVKPQVLPTVLEQLVAANVELEGKLLVSMAAGFTCKAFFKRLGECKLIRIMPNTPVKLGLGVTSVWACPSVSSAELDKVMGLMGNLGKLFVLQNEEEINVFGALAGSGPAFIYRFMEAMVDITVKETAFDKELARKMIEQVFLGTVEMCKQNPETEISALREAVTSKGGTTFQGLQQMTNYNFEEMMQEVIAACLRRSHELEKTYEE